MKRCIVLCAMIAWPTFLPLKWVLWGYAVQMLILAFGAYYRWGLRNGRAEALSHPDAMARRELEIEAHFAKVCPSTVIVQDVLQLTIPNFWRGLWSLPAYSQRRRVLAIILIETAMLVGRGDDARERAKQKHQKGQGA